MAGHSKWANIKHKKEKADAAKGKVFSRIAKEIIVAVKAGDPDPKNNPRLRLAIQKAKAVNMPNDNIDRNIKKASCKDQTNYDDIAYELYGYGGVGIIAQGMTDNRNRFASEIRIATNKRGGTIASPGSVLFNFDRKGVIEIEKKNLDEEKAFEAAIEAGAEDFELDDQAFMITTAPEQLYEVKDKLEALSMISTLANITMIPKTLVSCSKDDQKANLALVDWLESIEDVDEIFHNMEVS